jgi:hypothetical protein
MTSSTNMIKNNIWNCEERPKAWGCFNETYPELYMDDVSGFDLGHELKNMWIDWDNRYYEEESDENDIDMDYEYEDDDARFYDDNYCRRYSDCSMSSYYQERMNSNSVESVCSFVLDEQNEDFDVYGIKDIYLYT